LREIDRNLKGKDRGQPVRLPSFEINHMAGKKGKPLWENQRVLI
jgi:hypothetical protein